MFILSFRCRHFRDPERVSQTKFNLERWTEIVADPVLAKLPNRIETDRHGLISQVCCFLGKSSRLRARFSL
jgi:hypothetical protein